ncbi:FAD/NAD(P)-binding domain-containing protein [Aspergillus granulosus]|uniref:FAD/NAD(P)-binding domain-containing protein n=1 Tax=Aspergillus granulosus TaxID=176169 RepID=A0ABR4HEJ0_9EURO
MPDPSNDNLVDALIIGAGPAGLSAALTLARALHTVIVFDSQNYRNIKAAHMHAVTTWDHQSPHDFRLRARSDILSRYNTVEFHNLEIHHVEKTAQGLFHLVDENGALWRGRKLLLATGVRDIMPDIKGYSDCWVTGIFHCLFCHGYEDRHVNSCGVLCAGDLESAQPILHLARHAVRLVPRVTIYTNGREALSGEIMSLLREDENFNFDTRIIEKLVKGAEKTSVVLKFQDGSQTTEGFLVSRPRTALQGEFAAQLSCKTTKQGSVEITEPFCQTSVPGAFAAGDCAVLAKTVMNAMATGGFAGAAMAAQLEAEGSSSISAKP